MLTYTFYKPSTNDKKIVVSIQLLNTPFVEQWRNYMFDLYSRIPNILWYITRHAYNKRFLEPNQLIENLSRLHASYLFFQKKKIDNFANEINRIEHLFKYPHETNQNDLNIWHRHFTTLEGKYSNNSRMTPPNTLTMDLYEYIHDVNQYVHRCEGWTYADCLRRTKFDDSQMYAVAFTNANHMSAFAENDNKNVWDHTTPRFQKGHYDDIASGSDYTVWLHEDIIGKDLVKAWLDHDDLSAFDVAGNDTITPNVTFDPHKLYHRVLQDPEFIREKQRVGKTWDRQPLGNIINLHELDFEDILDKQVYSIELDGKLLWHRKETI